MQRARASGALQQRSRAIQAERIVEERSFPFSPAEKDVSGPARAHQRPGAPVKP